MDNAQGIKDIMFDIEEWLHTISQIECVGEEVIEPKRVKILKDGASFDLEFLIKNTELMETQAIVKDVEEWLTNIEVEEIEKIECRERVYILDDDNAKSIELYIIKN
jgi:hypothetical protein